MAGPEFTAEDARLLESFAATAAVSVHTATSVAEDRLRHSIEASEQERGRWARELHDETLQGLGGLQMLLSSALRGADPERLRAAVRDAVQQIGIEIANLRSLIVELRPPALDEIGLVPAIETLAQRVATSEGMTVETASKSAAKPAAEPSKSKVSKKTTKEPVKPAAKERPPSAPASAKKPAAKRPAPQVATGQAWNRQVGAPPPRATRIDIFFPNMLDTRPSLPRTQVVSDGLLHFPPSYARSWD